MSLPTVAIVILNYNGSNYLQQFLPSVLASTYPNKQIIVADNASIDNSIDLLKSTFPEVTLLLNTSNDGFAGGYNWALKRVEADYYILLNSDVAVDAGWIEPVIEMMEANKSIAAVQPKILDFYTQTQFEYAGASGGWIDILGYPFSRGRIFDVCEQDHNQYDDAVPVFWASGAAMFVRSNIYHEVGGFDDYFFAHQEEIDLCWRMQLAGYGIMVQPASKVYHVGGGTLPKGYRKNYLNYRNNLILLSKNLTVSEKCWKQPLRFLLDGIAIVKALVALETSTCKAIIAAYISFIQWRFSSLKRRKVAYSKKPMTSLTGVYKGSVVWQYFIKKNQHFNDLFKTY